MKHLVEFALCGAIGTYCVMRCAAHMPRVIAKAHAVVRIAVERRWEMEQLEEAAQ